MNKYIFEIWGVSKFTRQSKYFDLILNNFVFHAKKRGFDVLNSIKLIVNTGTGLKNSLRMTDIYDGKLNLIYRNVDIWWTSK